MPWKARGPPGVALAAALLALSSGTLRPGYSSMPHIYDTWAAMKRPKPGRAGFKEVSAAGRRPLPLGRGAAVAFLSTQVPICLTQFLINAPKTSSWRYGIQAGAISYKTLVICHSLGSDGRRHPEFLTPSPAYRAVDFRHASRPAATI